MRHIITDEIMNNDSLLVKDIFITWSYDSVTTDIIEFMFLKQSKLETRKEHDKLYEIRVIMFKNINPEMYNTLTVGMLKKQFTIELLKKD